MAGNIVTNADDMANWMKMNVDGGRLNGVQVIPESVINGVHNSYNVWPMGVDFYSKPVIPETIGAGGYGGGIIIGSYRGRYTIKGP